MSVKMENSEVRVKKPIKSILVSQPEPTDANSPYYKLAEKYNLKVDFRSFIQVDPVSVKDFRNQKVDGVFAGIGAIIPQYAGL